MRTGWGDFSLLKVQAAISYLLFVEVCGTRELSRGCDSNSVRVPESPVRFPPPIHPRCGFATLGNAHQEKEILVEKVNRKWLERRKNQEIKVIIQKVKVDEMESYVEKKIYQRWLWHEARSLHWGNFSFRVGKKRRPHLFEVKKITKTIWNYAHSILMD